jgi:repressor LexA
MADDGQYLSRLQDYYARHQVVPSYSRIGALVGLNSKASVADLVARLKAKGFLESSPDKRLKPGRRFFERTSVEGVAAGLPALAPDTAPDKLSIDEHLVTQPSNTVLINVKGHTMIDAGNNPGQVVV